MTTPKHTPLPWRAFDNAGHQMQSYSQSSGIVAGPDASSVMLVAGFFHDIGGPDVAAANAALVARAVNAHDTLVAALEQASDALLNSVPRIWNIATGQRHTEVLQSVADALALAGVSQAAQAAPAEAPQTGSDITEVLMGNLFARFEAIYLQQWRSNFRSPHAADGWRAVWLEAFERHGITMRMASDATARCIDSFPAPPSLPEFIALCKGRT